jgi:hypothetical protein
LVSALDWGSRGREFKSPQPDKEVQVRGYSWCLQSACSRLIFGTVVAKSFS